MSDPVHERALRRYRGGYLKLRSALFDATTCLPAFPVLFDDVRMMFERVPAVGVLHVEIDQLALVESIYGWQVFDRIVARIAGRLREALAGELPEGSLLALNGIAGDRFVLFVPPGAGAAESTWLTGLADEVRVQLDRTLEHPDFRTLSPRLCARTGHAVLRLDPFFRFERCVYSAVDEARGANERREQRRERSWSLELREIVRGARMESVYQPIVDLRTRSVLGYEALVRGPRDSPFEGPRAMFALSARMGMAEELDRACCEAALRGFAPRPERSRLFLNVLPRTVGDEWIERDLRPKLEAVGLAPGELVLELSERAATAEPESTARCVESCRRHGVGLALDDVGTARGELAAIERMRPDFLKLDGSLVRGLDQNLVQQEVLRTLARLAVRIGADVIAEGVESEAEAATALAGGARYGQGYRFAAPGPAGRSPSWPARRSDPEA